MTKLAPGAEAGIRDVTQKHGIARTNEELESLAGHIFAVGVEGRGVVDFSYTPVDVVAADSGDGCPFDVTFGQDELRKRLRGLRRAVKFMREDLKTLEVQIKALSSSLIDTDTANFLVNSIRAQRKDAQIWGGSPIGRELEDCMDDVVLILRAAETATTE